MHDPSGHGIDGHAATVAFATVVAALGAVAIVRRVWARTGMGDPNKGTGALSGFIV